MKNIEKYIEIIEKAIIKQIPDTRGIKNLEIDFSLDGADNPVIKVKLKTYSKI